MTSLIVVSAARRPWGAEASLRTLLPALVTEYDSVSVIVPTSETAAKFEDIAGVTVRLVRYNSKIGYLLALWRLLRKEKRDSHVLVFSLQLVPVVVPLRLTRPGMELVADLHDAPRDPVDYFAVRLLLPLFHRIIAISSYVRSHFSNSRAVVVPRPIEPTHARARRVEEPLTLGIAGRIDREKEIELAIGVAAAVPSIELVIFGEGLTDGDDYLAGLRNLAVKEAPGRVEFAGRVPPEEIYSRIDVLFVGNRNEPSGRTVGEAMWAGLPVITPSTGGSSEFYEHNESGLKYTAGSLNSAVEAARRLLDPSVRAQIGHAARVRMQTSRHPHDLTRAYAAVVRGHLK